MIQTQLPILHEHSRRAMRQTKRYAPNSEHVIRMPMIVACELGFLYNKEAVIEKLLDSKGNKDSDSNKNDIGSHIRSLKVSVRFASVEHASSVFKKKQGYEGQGTPVPPRSRR